MKKYFLLLIIVGSLCATSQVMGHPPTDLDVDYDMGSQMLNVQMRHTTHDPREDFIRKIVITVGTTDPVVKRYNIQLNTLEFSDNILIPAEVGDLITVKAFSREGGSAIVSITVKAVDKKVLDGNAATTENPKQTKKKTIKDAKGSGY